MKKCPTCGAAAEDGDVFCEVDGTKLAGAAAAAVVAGGASGRCSACGADDADAGDGYCSACGHKLAATGAALPPSAPATIGDYTVVRAFGDGDLVVRDGAGASRLLLYGPGEAIRLEAMALAAAGSPLLPKVIAEGDAGPLGRYVVVAHGVDQGRPIDVPPSLSAALGWVRSLLDAATDLESKGFAWEPSPPDLRLDGAGNLALSRARGARRLLPGEKASVKKALEALGAALVPAPLCLSTPGLLRLFLPRSNYTTLAAITAEAARAELATAEATMAARGGDLAELCDAGVKKAHNEDATSVVEGVVSGEPYKIIVVCDGVSTSTHAEQASNIAARVTRDALGHFARSGDILREGAASAVATAIRAAHVAICASPIDAAGGPPPGTTIVAALVFRKSLTVGWVGDSRAYWVSDHGAELCTTDHSWVNEAVARGEVTMAEALVAPLAHALTKCLGPLENDPGVVQEVDPGVRTKALPGAGRLVLCTDGLWNYFPEASDIAALVHGAGKDADPAAVCRFLVCRALAAGGGDNVSAAVLDVK